MAKLNASGVFAWQRVRHVLKFNKVKYGTLYGAPGMSVKRETEQLSHELDHKQTNSLVTCVVPYPADGGVEVDEHRVQVAALLSLVEGTECLVDWGRSLH